MADEVTVRDVADLKASPSWDSIWPADFDAGLADCADWAVAGEEETWNRGGLQAIDPVATAIIICLFTDARRPDGIEGEDDASDRRGWHGDSFDIDAAAGERPIGSLLWTLERASLTYETRRLAEHYAAEALQSLIDQGVLSRVEVSAEIETPAGRLVISIKAYGPDGQRLYANSLPLF